MFNLTLNCNEEQQGERLSGKLKSIMKFRVETLNVGTMRGGSQTFAVSKNALAWCVCQNH